MFTSVPFGVRCQVHWYPADFSTSNFSRRYPSAFLPVRRFATNGRSSLSVPASARKTGRSASPAPAVDEMRSAMT
jgi:hypothetical protein